MNADHDALWRRVNARLDAGEDPLGEEPLPEGPVDDGALLDALADEPEVLAAVVRLRSRLEELTDRRGRRTPMPASAGHRARPRRRVLRRSFAAAAALVLVAWWALRPAPAPGTRRPDSLQPGSLQPDSLQPGSLQPDWPPVARDPVTARRGGVVAFRAVVTEVDRHSPGTADTRGEHRGRRSVERRVELGADGGLVHRISRSVRWGASSAAIPAGSAVLSFRAVVVEP